MVLIAALDLARPEPHLLSGSDGRAAALRFGGGRKVRAPRRQGGGQHPPGATPGIAPQKANRLRLRPVARVKGWGKSPPRPR